MQGGYEKIAIFGQDLALPKRLKGSLFNYLK